MLNRKSAVHSSKPISISCDTPNAEYHCVFNLVLLEQQKQNYYTSKMMKPILKFLRFKNKKLKIKSYLLY